MPGSGRYANGVRQSPAPDEEAAGGCGSANCPLPTAPVPPTLAPRKIPILRVVGQLAATYIVAEGPDGMYLIDQHAAHERILYEQLLAAKADAGRAGAARCLTPLVLELSPEQAGVVGQELATLRELGVDIEPFGGNAYLLRAVPAILSRDDPQKALA